MLPLYLRGNIFRPVDAFCWGETAKARNILKGLVSRPLESREVYIAMDCSHHIYEVISLDLTRMKTNYLPVKD